LKVSHTYCIRWLYIILVIQEEFANVLTWEEFEAVYHKAVDGDMHDILTVDPNAAEGIRFRRNFDAFLVP
jgi:hypothetical protein